MSTFPDFYFSLLTNPFVWIILGLVVLFYVIQSLTARPGSKRNDPADRLAQLGRQIGMEGISPALVLIALVTWSILALTLLGGIYVILWQVILYDIPNPDQQKQVWNWRFTLAQLAALTTVLGAVIALPVTINRLILSRRQTKTAEEGLITDRINKAVEMLGAEKTVKRDGKEFTQPNLEVRIGAIYALERIAQDSDRDHVQIMEILCAYIRQNAPAESAVEWPTLEMHDGEEDGPLAGDWRERLKTFREKQEALKKTLTCRTDIQTALSVIGRRTAHQRALEAEAGHGKKGDVFVFDTPCPTADLPDDEYDPRLLDAFREKLTKWKNELYSYRGYQLDLRHCNLQGADLSRLNLNGAIFDGARMQGVNLECAHTVSARFVGVQLQGANLKQSLMLRANIENAEIQGANLAGVFLEGATLMEVNLHGADLTLAYMQEALLRKTQIQGGRLACARMQGARLWEVPMQETDHISAQMQGADLWKTHMHGADLRGAQMQGTGLREVQLNASTNIWTANLSGAYVSSTDVSYAPQITEHIPNMFGDGTVKLPQICLRPSHWPKHDLGDAFDAEWRKWQADPENYQPPVKEDEAAG